MKSTSKKTKKTKPTSVHKKAAGLFFFLIFGLIGLLFLTISFAAPKPTATGPRLYISPGSGRYSIGQTIKAQVWMDGAGQTINAVQANLAYDANVLEFVQFDNTGSSFDLNVQSLNTSGAIYIAKGSYTALTGSHLISTVEFKVKNKARSTSVSFASGSEIDSATTNSNVLASTQKASYSIR